MLRVIAERIFIENVVVFLRVKIFGENKKRLEDTNSFLFEIIFLIIFAVSVFIDFTITI